MSVAVGSFIMAFLDVLSNVYLSLNGDLIG